VVGFFDNLQSVINNLPFLKSIDLTRDTKLDNTGYIMPLDILSGILKTFFGGNGYFDFGGNGPCPFEGRKRALISVFITVTIY